jgi:hypothetical protein
LNELNLGYFNESDKRENHRKNGHCLDNAERSKIVGKSLIGLCLCIAGGSTGTTLEKRRKTDAKT